MTQTYTNNHAAPLSNELFQHNTKEKLEFPSFLVPQETKSRGNKAKLTLYVAAYLYGSLPVVYLLGRQREVDLKQIGSGNVGATNLMATGSPVRAIVGWLFDASKGAIPALLARRLGFSDEAADLASVCGVAGQCWPLFLGFEGGRGISAYVGASAMMNRSAWPFALLPMIGGSLWKVASHPRFSSNPAATTTSIRSKSVPLGCFISSLIFPLADGVISKLRPSRATRQNVSTNCNKNNSGETHYASRPRLTYRGIRLAPIFLSLVILLRRLTATQPDDAECGPTKRSQALLYRLLYDRNTSE